jgi:hypothetical protein
MAGLRRAEPTGTGPGRGSDVEAGGAKVAVEREDASDAEPPAERDERRVGVTERDAAEFVEDGPCGGVQVGIEGLNVEQRTAAKDRDEPERRIASEPSADKRERLTGDQFVGHERTARRP